ncbi:MAG: sensor histidine kinase N-terminal domain-containing protein [Betaproteobacteria bacterium]|nr:sensor histidine kinase N-terminal domain-containing protein [Betaproteobacteria bacterium]
MSDRSLRAHLLRLLLLPIAGVLAVGAVAAYYLALEPATDAHDASLVDAGIALGERIRTSGGVTTVDLPFAAEQVLRTDPYDKVFYAVRDPQGHVIAGDAGIPLPDGVPLPREGTVFYDAVYGGAKIRAASYRTHCGDALCTITVAETTQKRNRLVRQILIGSVLPQALLATLTLVIVWFGVARGLAPLERLSQDIRRRSAEDLSPVAAARVPEETRPLIQALNDQLERLAALHRNQQRFLANAAHQLRTPLAGLQAHAELALAQPLPEAARAQVDQVHSATVRTARLANQLLALARAESGMRPDLRADLDLRTLAESAADEWVHRALGRDLDLGLELSPALVRGDALLLSEAIGNLVHNALEYVPRGGHVTVRTGVRGERAFVEVEDDGPGIPPAERSRVTERFYRMPGTSGTGSGLGLAIVSEIAAAHEASMQIDSGAGGRGCRVEIRFPDPRTPQAGKTWTA